MFKAARIVRKAMQELPIPRGTGRGHWRVKSRVIADISPPLVAYLPTVWHPPLRVDHNEHICEIDIGRPGERVIVRGFPDGKRRPLPPQKKEPSNFRRLSQSDQMRRIVRAMQRTGASVHASTCYSQLEHSSSFETHYLGPSLSFPYANIHPIPFPIYLNKSSKLKIP
jgi:hypothetical protein